MGYSQFFWYNSRWQLPPRYDVTTGVRRSLRRYDAHDIQWVVVRSITVTSKVLVDITELVVLRFQLDGLLPVLRCSSKCQLPPTGTTYHSESKGTDRWVLIFTPQRYLHIRPD